MRYRIAVMAVVTTLSIGFFTPANAQTAGGANNIVIVTNTSDGQTVSRSGMMVSFDPGDTVANNNLAIATSTACEGCRTVSVAMQVIVVESFPSDFRPANVASAENGGCNSCDTEAFAFQHSVQPGVMVHLSAAGRQAIVGLRSQVASLADRDLPYLEMKTQLEALFGQLVAIVNGEVEASGAQANGVTYESAQAA